MVQVHPPQWKKEVALQRLMALWSFSLQVQLRRVTQQGSLGTPENDARAFLNRVKDGRR